MVLSLMVIIHQSVFSLKQQNHLQSHLEHFTTKTHHKVTYSNWDVPDCQASHINSFEVCCMHCINIQNLKQTWLFTAIEEYLKTQPICLVTQIETQYRKKKNQKIRWVFTGSYQFFSKFWLIQSSWHSLDSFEFCLSD